MRNCSKPSSGGGHWADTKLAPGKRLRAAALSHSFHLKPVWCIIAHPVINFNILNGCGGQPEAPVLLATDFAYLLNGIIATL